jgi:hypothetical protein
MGFSFLDLEAVTLGFFFGHVVFLLLSSELNPSSAMNWDGF